MRWKSFGCLMFISVAWTSLRQSRYEMEVVRMSYVYKCRLNFLEAVRIWEARHVYPDGGDPDGNACHVSPWGAWHVFSGGGVPTGTIMTSTSPSLFLRSITIFYIFRRDHHQGWICMSCPSLSRIWDHIDITFRGGSLAQQKTWINTPFNHFLEFFCNCSAKLVSWHPVVSSICTSPLEQNTKVSCDGLIFIFWIKNQ